MNSRLQTLHHISFIVSFFLLPTLGDIVIGHVCSFVSSFVNMASEVISGKVELQHTPTFMKFCVDV